MFSWGISCASLVTVSQRRILLTVPMKFSKMSCSPKAPRVHSLLPQAWQIFTGEVALLIILHSNVHVLYLLVLLRLSNAAGKKHRTYLNAAELQVRLRPRSDTLAAASRPSRVHISRLRQVGCPRTGPPCSHPHFLHVYEIVRA